MSDARTEPYMEEFQLDEIEPRRKTNESMVTGRRQRRLRIAVAVLLGALASIALWSVVWHPRPATQPQQSVERREPAPPPAVTDAPAARYPIETEAIALPPLDTSDSAMLSALIGLWGGRLSAYIEPRELVRNFVATVDNLPRRALSPQRLPVRPAAGMFVATNTGQGLVIADANAQRYSPYIQLFDAVDSARMVAFYVRHYPLFQQAYRELGYPAGHFNDRLVEAIDVMIAAPDAGPRLRVAQPKVFYEFVDRDLEALPAGQKLMLRIGPENGAIVKRKLREVRTLLTTPAQKPEAAAAASAVSRR